MLFGSMTVDQYVEHFSSWLNEQINELEAQASQSGFCLSRRELILAVQQQALQEAQEKYENDPDRMPVQEWEARLAVLQKCFDNVLRKAQN